MGRTWRLGSKHHGQEPTGDGEADPFGLDLTEERGLHVGGDLDGALQPGIELLQQGRLLSQASFERLEALLGQRPLDRNDGGGVPVMALPALSLVLGVCRVTSP
ncbi:hypothetical protein SAMN05444166_8065 [Singulisphaera sp. GP187]|uniref:hypothetical protein n=1 Tax=Singulisphaera sp. GP187 TaxID=1882752 RepID=UPI0009278B72|nr:hypothetical protein [Singulisphaera sp. GP187]SIO66396.1 hypothetical protein SAMN05444166_8065 [Singulisphaera sp. GP187]